MTGPETSHSEADSPADVLHLIRSGRARTRNELGRATGLARSTVAQRVDTLKAAGLVVESDEAAPSTGGRPPSLLSFNADAGLVLAADLGATHSRVAVSNLVAEPLVDTSADLDIDEGPIEVLAWLDEAFRDLLAQIGRPLSEVKGVGIGLPGPVDFGRGVPVMPPIMAGWHLFPVAKHCRALYDVPILVDNDVNMMAVGEYWIMSPKVDDFVFIKVGTGIGSGLVLGGRLHRGAKGAAGDIGHLTSTPDGPSCRCGNNGCLEAMAGGRAVAAQLRARGFEAANTRDVVELIRQGNREAVKAVRESGRLLGHVLASTVNLLNPALIMIGGDMAQAEAELLAGVREVVYQRSTTLSTTDLQIITSSLGDRAGITGAAAMVLDHIFTPAAIDRVLADA